MSRILAPGRQHISCDYLSGWQMDASVPFNRESLTISTYNSFLQYARRAAGEVSPCRACLLLSIGVKPSYLFLEVVLETGG